MAQPERSVRRLKLHPDIIFDIIKRQAGTLQKALLEGVMNSIDAGATRCEIRLDEKTFEIVDDGRGFQSREEIDEFFDTFGTPHKEKSDKRFGAFRIGRGQLMAFAKVRYDSGAFAMEVDVQNRGTDYDFTDFGEDRTAGCRIRGVLYKPMGIIETQDVEIDFAKLVKYAFIPVFLNGKRINKTPDSMKWDIETEDYYLKWNSSGPMKVYNMGVHVTDYPSYSYPSCTVVSKRPLIVNAARTDVIVSECPIWQKIVKQARAQARGKRTKRALSTEDRERLLRGILSGSERYADLEKNEKNLIEIANGRNVSLERFVDFISGYKAIPLCVAPRAGDLIGEKLYSARIAFVLSPRGLERFGVDTPQEALDLVCESMERHPHSWGNCAHFLRYLKKNAKVIEYEELAKTYFDDDHAIVPQRDYTEEDKVLLNTLHNINETGFYDVPAIELDRERRDIYLGKSRSAVAWTDGKSYIVFNRIEGRKLLRKGLPGVFSMALTLAHEYCHSGSTAGTHSHGPEFDKLYRDVLESLDVDIAKIACRAAILTVREMKKRGIRITRAWTSASELAAGIDAPKDEPSIDKTSEAEFPDDGEEIRFGPH